MSKQASENEFKELADLLVQRGFATRCTYHQPSGLLTIEWTADGLHLQTLLHRLFDLPRQNPAEITSRHLLQVMQVLFTPR